MTGDPRSRPVADGGTHHAALFESCPDPLLAYASQIESDESEGTSDASEGLVVRQVNAAFEATFGVGADEVAGSPLDGVVLPGTLTPVPGADDATAGTDASASGAGVGADTGTADAGDADTEDVAGSVEEVDDSDATAQSATTTAGSILDRVRDAGAAVRFRHGTDDGTRHFRVRAITPGIDDEGGYLLFTDVTELERQRCDLARTVARLERLVSVASHDLRNPLEVAEIRLDAARDTGEAVHFEKVAGALDRIEHIVQDVLAVGGGGVDPTDAVALEDVAEVAWETVDTADATLVTSTGLPTVRGDADRLRQLFENLFRNAVEHGSTSSRPEADDAVEHGGRSVTVTVEPLPGGFAVADDGPGIPADAHERVFEAGYSTAPDNTGLGLFIVQRIAREHDWRVSLASGRESSADADVGARIEFTGVECVGSRTDPSEPDGSSGTGGSAEPNGSVEPN